MNKRNRLIITSLCLLIAVIYFFVEWKNNGNAVNAGSNISDDYVEFFDVGQGDCALISSNGRNCLIDTGTSKSSFSIREKLEEKKIKDLDLISISHFHVDHTGSLYDIVKQFYVANLMFPKELSDSNIPKDVISAKQECIAEDGEFVVSNAGQTVDLGDFKLSVLYQNIKTDDENNRSVYIMAKIGNKKFFFTGDGEKGSENNILNEGLDIKCDVLKVPHHGGRNSSSYEFLSKCSPEYAVISCGEGNSYGHPHKEAIDRLIKQKAKIYRTDADGDVIFNIDNNKISVTTENK